MLNVQMHLLWASSRQHECGIKQNKLSESVLLQSYLDEWLHLYVHLSTCVHTHTHTHISICVYEFMNQKCFSRHIWIQECASLWIKSAFPDLPFQDGHKLVYWLVICSVTNGVFTADSVCAHLLRRLLLGSIFSTHFHKKHTNFVYVFL